MGGGLWSHSRVARAPCRQPPSPKGVLTKPRTDFRTSWQKGLSLLSAVLLASASGLQAHICLRWREIHAGLWEGRPPLPSRPVGQECSLLGPLGSGGRHTRTQIPACRDQGAAHSISKIPVLSVRRR